MTNRRGFLKLSGFAFATCLTAGCASVSSSFNQAKRPNILVIVTDDQGWADMSAYGHHAADINTPNIDRIAKRGILFTQGYVSGPVCSPSRAGWNTGKYQQRWGHTGWGAALPEEVPTLAEYFKNAGYVTGKFGKSDFGSNYHRADVREYPLNHGYDEFLGFSAHAHDYFLHSQDIANRTPDPNGASEALGPLFYNNTKKEFKDGEYLTEIFTDYSIDFIERNKQNPFYLSLSYNSVHHMIHEVPDRYLEKFGASKIPNYNPDTDGKYAAYYHKWAHPKLDQKTHRVADIDMYRKFYLANLDCLDENIGKVLDKLDSAGIADNTIIVFFSDNGGSPITGADNSPLEGSKYTLFEGGIRIPFAISYPANYAKGKQYNGLVSTLDIAPTLLAAANIDYDAEAFDGVELDSTFAEAHLKKIDRPEPLYWLFGNEYAIRDGDWKLAKCGHFNYWEKRKDYSIRLYNLANDEQESVNLADKMPEKVKELQAKYDLWKASMDESAKKLKK